MKRIEQCLALLLTLSLFACSNDSGRQEATGKGNVRAINAVPASPEIGFLIEERLIAGVPYKSVSALAQWDDLDFNFNFEVLFAGDTQNTRIITRNLDVVADQDYVFLISGTVTAPAITLWESPIREFTANDTAFQMRFAHTASVLGAIDYYFAADGVVPALGQAVATLSFGEISALADFEAGSYVVTITSAGDPADVLYMSTDSAFVAQSDLIVTPFDGDADDNASIVVRLIGSQGTITNLPDPGFPASVEFLHAAFGLGAFDVYDDEALTSQLLAGHAFQDLSANTPVSADINTYRYTPTGDTSVITAEGSLTTVRGQQHRFILFGDSATPRTVSFPLDRSPIDTAVKIQFFQTSVNFEFVDFYIVNAGVSIDEQIAFRTNVSAGAASAAAGVAAGSYDLYVTNAGDKTVLAGPTRIDVALGDVVDLFVFDTVDPNMLDLQLLP